MSFGGEQLRPEGDRSRSDCVHEQVAKLGPVSRAAGMDCECPLYIFLSKLSRPQLTVIR